MALDTTEWSCCRNWRIVVSAGRVTSPQVIFFHRKGYLFTSLLYSASYCPLMHPTRVVSSENFWRRHDSKLYLKSQMYRVNRKGQRAVTWGPLCCSTPSLTNCSLVLHTVVRCWGSLLSRSQMDHPTAYTRDCLPSVQAVWYWRHLEKSKSMTHSVHRALSKWA